MWCRYIDAMALVQRFGKPDLFLTMTCNPSWVEIKEELRSGEEAQNRPDLISHISISKLESFKTDILRKHVLGHVAAYVYVRVLKKRPSTPPIVPQQLALPPQLLVSEYTERKIYVSNVRADLDTQKLLTFFSSYGEIGEGSLGFGKATCRQKGFYLFVYRAANCARKALEEP
ncbi:ATP-dependent DNA helicase [Quillaja saponaria]|uniref:ATP-dependent DNA helicase n=1 Tax=Quillaja saponaria TaxID=32244 RepID=A0AAD7KNK7_QUISA|nr:ATP-dependent DNA helicase [Quillaja saponaria]